MTQLWTADKWLPLAGLTGVELPKYVTSFVDKSNPRPGSSDLYFYPASDTHSFRKEITDPTLPPILYFSWPDLAGLFVASILPVCFIALAVCAWKNTTLIKHYKPEGPAFPKRTTTEGYLAATTVVLSLIVGSFFALALFGLPYLYVIRTVLLVSMPEKTLESTRFRKDRFRHLLYLRFCSLSMVGMAGLYVYYVIRNVYSPM